MYSIYSAAGACFQRNQQNLPDRIDNNERAFKATIQTPGGKTFFILGIITAAGLIGVGYFLGIGGAVGTYCFIGGGAGLFLLDVTVLAVQSCRNASRLQAYIRQQQGEEQVIRVDNIDEQALRAQIQGLQEELQRAQLEKIQLEQANQQLQQLQIQLEQANQQLQQLQIQLEQANQQQLAVPVNDQKVQALTQQIEILRSNFEEARVNKELVEQLRIKKIKQKKIIQELEIEIQALKIEVRLLKIEVNQSKIEDELKIEGEKIKENLQQTWEEQGQIDQERTSQIEVLTSQLETQSHEFNRVKQEMTQRYEQEINEINVKLQSEKDKSRKFQLEKAKLEEHIKALQAVMEELGFKTVEEEIAVHLEEIEKPKSELSGSQSSSLENRDVIDLTTTVMTDTDKGAEEIGGTNLVLKQLEQEHPFLVNLSNDETEPETVSFVMKAIGTPAEAENELPVIPKPLVDVDAALDEQIAQLEDPNNSTTSSGINQTGTQAFIPAPPPLFLPVNEEPTGKEEQVSLLDIPPPPPFNNLFGGMTGKQPTSSEPIINKIPGIKQSELLPLMDENTKKVIQVKLRSESSVEMQYLIDNVKKYLRKKIIETSANKVPVSESGSANKVPVSESGSANKVPVSESGNDCSIFFAVKENEEVLDINIKNYLKQLSQYVKAVVEGPERNVRIRLALQSLKDQIKELTPDKGNKGQKLSKEEQELQLQRLESEKKEQLEKEFLNVTNFEKFEKRYNLQDLKKECFTFFEIAMANCHMRLMSNNHGINNVDAFNKLNNDLRLKIEEVKANKNSQSIKELDVMCKIMKDVLTNFSSCENKILNNMDKFFNTSTEVEIKKEEKKKVVGSNSNVPVESEEEKQQRLQKEVKKLMTFEWAEENLTFSGDLSSLELEPLNPIKDAYVEEALCFGDDNISNKPQLIELNEKMQQAYKNVEEEDSVACLNEKSVKAFKSLCEQLKECLKAIQGAKGLPKMESLFKKVDKKIVAN